MLAGIVGIAPLASAQSPPAGDPSFRAGGIVLGAPPSAPPTAAPATTLTIAELQLTTQVAFGRPVDRVTTFSRNQAPIFAWFRYAGGRRGDQLSGRLVFLAPAGEIEAVTVSAPLDKPDDIGYFKLAPPADGWPEGRYRLDLLSGGSAVRSQEFQVGAPR